MVKRKKCIIEKSSFHLLPGGGMGHPGPHSPHLPCPETWTPSESTAVEHHEPYWSTIHSVKVMLLIINGKTQGTCGSAPPLVKHTKYQINRIFLFRYLIKFIHIGWQIIID